MDQRERKKYIKANVIKDLERGGEWPLWLYRDRETANVFSLGDIRRNERAFAGFLAAMSREADCAVPRYAREVLDADDRD